jgi:hypothetical protein
MFVPDSEVLQFQCKKLTSLSAMTIEKGKCQGNVIDSHLPTHKRVLDCFDLKIVGSLWVAGFPLFHAH